MRSSQIHETGGQRTFVAVLDSGDEVMTSLEHLARIERLTAAQVTGIGAFSEAVLLYFDWDAREYREIPVGDQVEVAAMLGDIGEDEQGEFWYSGGGTGPLWQAI